jgi:hypothetical protein
MSAAQDKPVDRVAAGAPGVANTFSTTAAVGFRREARKSASFSPCCRSGVVADPAAVTCSLRRVGHT